MLILTRNTDQSIVIDGHIMVKILGVSGGQVRLGITADKDVIVDREEIHERRSSGEWEEHTDD